LVWVAGLVYGVELALGVLTVTGFGLAIAGLVKPRAGLLGVGILCVIDSPAQVFLMTGGLWRWNSFNYFLLLVLFVFAPLALRWTDVHTRLLLVFLVVLSAGLVISSQPELGVFHMLGIGAIFGLRIFFDRAPDLDDLYWLGIVCAALGIVGAVVFFVRASSFSSINPNAFSYMPLTGLFAASLGLIVAQGPGRGYVLVSLLAAANLAAVFLTGSRGALLVGLWCALVFVVALPGVGRRAMILSAALLLSLGLTSQFTPLQERTIARIDNLLDRERSLTLRTSGRFDLVKGGLRIFQANPLGVGTGAYVDYWQDLTQRERFTDFRRGNKVAAHSAWIKTLAENGVLGAVMLTLYVLSFAMVGTRLGGMEKTAGILTTGVLALAFLTTEFQSKGLWLLAAAVTSMLCRRPLARPEKENKPSKAEQVFDLVRSS
jgi:hypothetical protein